MNAEKIEKICDGVKAFNDMCDEYIKLKGEIESLKRDRAEKEKKLHKMKPIDQRRKELLHEAWRMEIEETEADKVIKKVSEMKEKIEELEKQKDDIQEKILDTIITLPFPINPDDVKKEEGYYKISTLEKAVIKNESYQILGKILDLGVPLKVNRVAVRPEAWKIKAESVEDALTEAINAIKTIRGKARFMKKVFGEVDNFCERVHKSERYRHITLLISQQGRILPKEASEKIGVKERIAYDTCYNLTRNSLWNPPLVKKEEGYFSLTTFGSLVMKRYTEKYGLGKGVEPNEQPLTEKEKKLENFMKK